MQHRSNGLYPDFLASGFAGIRVGVHQISFISASLIAGFLGLATNLVAFPAQAQEQFGNQGIIFDVDTVVEFEFVQSDGVYQSTFGVVNLTTGEQIPLMAEERSRTRGMTVPNPLAEFEFEADTPYAFYLESRYNGQPAQTIYSLSDRNPGNQRLLMFDGDFIDLAEGGILLRWDDTGSLLVPPDQQDRDFDDFTVRAGGHLACPTARNNRIEITDGSTSGGNWTSGCHHN
ncbi:MAG: hypothetical protein ACFE0J_24810 [Elainellaceae cyanobacterium]